MLSEYRVYLVDQDDHFYDAIPLICANTQRQLSALYGWLSVTALSFGSLTERSLKSRTKIKIGPHEMKPSARFLVVFLFEEVPSWPKARTAKNWSGG